MQTSSRITLVISLFFLIPFSSLLAQTWNLVKESDGIKLSTRNEPNSTLKSFRGEAVFHASTDKVFHLLGNPKNTDWWDKSISHIRLLGYEEDKFFQYYIVYDMPWPLTDRDMVVDTRITTNSATGERIVQAKPLVSAAVPEKEGIVRIRNYWQKWTIQPLDKGNLRVTLEGYIDPGGSVPAWFYNLVITETPLRAIRSLRDRALSPKPARD